MKRKSLITIAIIVSVVILLLGIGIGSVFIAPLDILRIISDKLFSTNLSAKIKPIYVSILWNVRLPRALLAFFVGAALSVSGAVMQSVLRNPLASSFTLGVSSGASLGAGIVILFGITLPFFGSFTLPFMGLLFGVLAVFVAIGFASKVDRNLENNTIILVGMVFSLFITAILSSLSSYHKEKAQFLVLWQMGSFASREWLYVIILIVTVIIGTILIMGLVRELDIMTFGEDQAKSVGVDVKKVKWMLLGISSILTGVSVAFAGVIGFVDLVIPHIVRKLYGSSHRFVIPLSAILGGAFMVAVDLIARTIASPAELSVGSVTALIGAPFFAYVYFSSRKKVS